LLRVDLQFYAFLTVVLCGAAFGLLFDVLRAARAYFRPNRLVAALGDILFWLVATVILAGGIFYANWAEFRLYVAIGIFLGAGLYFWLASPVAISLVHGLFKVSGWFLRLLATAFLRLVWAPILVVVRILWTFVRILYTGLARVADLLLGILGWIFRPAYRFYRWLKLHYLLAKRRWRRRFRR